MKYLCLIYIDEKAAATIPLAEYNAIAKECLAYEGSLRETGKVLAAEALQPVECATTLRVRNGQLSMTDGPFAETREQLGGFYMIDARDLNEAIQIAAKIPPGRLGSIEVRPIREWDFH